MRRSVSSVAGRASRGIPADVRSVTLPPTARIDRVRLVQEVAQDDPHDFAKVRAFEVEDAAAAGGGLRLRRGRHPAARRLSLHDHAGAPVDVGLQLVLRRRHAGLRSGGGVGERRRHAARRGGLRRRRVTLGREAASGTRRGAAAARKWPPRRAMVDSSMLLSVAGVGVRRAQPGRARLSQVPSARVIARAVAGSAGTRFASADRRC